jgi:hypothetical protein
MAYRDSTTATGFSTTPSVAVPSGVAAGDIVILVAATDNVAAVFETADWPSGFTELAEVDLTLDGHSAAVGWKRLTAADSGSYTFGNIAAGESNWVCQAFAFSGRHATDPPVATSATNNNANSSPVSITATGVTAVAGDDLLWLSTPDVSESEGGAGHTAPTDFTEKEDAENNWSNISGAVRENASAGATGNITGTLALSSGASGWAAFLVRIPAAAAAGLSIPVAMAQYRQRWR